MLIEDGIDLQKLEFNSFNEYPHYVYATAFLVNDMLADYKIGNGQKSWNTRTFRGLIWESNIINNMKNYKFECEYRKIFVNNDKEHNKAFEILKNWINDFKKLNFTDLVEKV